MIKQLPALAMLATALQVSAEPIDYESIVNTMRINAQGKVQFSVLLREEDDEILCDDEGYHFNFLLDNNVMDKWYDTLVLARSANSLLNFQYDHLGGSDCELQAITMPLLYQRGETPGEEPGGEKLRTTGNYGNVALVGTNGLSADSYSSNTFYGQDAPEAAFDGYVYTEKTNQDAADKVGRGIWLVKKEYQDGRLVSPWLQIDFGKEVSLIGTRIFVNKKSLELGRSPRNVTILTSTDGQEFTKYESFVLSLKEVSSTPFSAPLKSRYFRLFIESNYGDDTFIEVDEWELYQEE